MLVATDCPEELWCLYYEASKKMRSLEKELMRRRLLLSQLEASIFEAGVSAEGIPVTAFIRNGKGNCDDGSGQSDGDSQSCLADEVRRLEVS